MKKYIVEKYDHKIKTRIREYEKCLIRKSSLTNDLIFNIKCRNEGLIPRSLRVKALISSTSGRKIAERASRSFLQERIRMNHYDKVRAEKDSVLHEKEIKKVLSNEDYEKVVKISKLSAEKTFQKVKCRHLKKIEELRKEKNGRELKYSRKDHIKKNWLVNISKEKLTTEEEDFLKLGLNFAPTPRNIPYIEFVAGIESAMYKAKISKDMSKELTSRICLAINKSQKPECNMLTSQCKALKSLKERKI